MYKNAMYRFVSNFAFIVYHRWRYFGCVVLWNSCCSRRFGV